jgi:hypothetical protein
VSEHVRARTANGRVILSLTPEAAGTVGVALGDLRARYATMAAPPDWSPERVRWVRIAWLAYLDDLGETLQAARDECGEPAVCECPSCVVLRELPG